MDVAREEDEVAAADERRGESIRSHETIAVHATSGSSEDNTQERIIHCNLIYTEQGGRKI